jgi:hypothetical protein
MNAYLIFGIVALIAFAFIVLGKVFAGVGVIILFAEVIVFAFFILFHGDDIEPPGPKI